MIWWSRGLVDLALTGYLWAAIQALLELARGRAGGPVPTRGVVTGAWVLHTVGLVLRGIAAGQPPVGGLHATLSLIVWAAVLLLLWGEHRPRLPGLRAFVLPPAALLGLAAAAVPEASVFRGTPVPGLWSHALFAVLGLGALAANFAGGVMYVLQERGIRTHRPGRLSRRLPPLEALDRFSFQALVVGFSFLTLGIVLGTIAAAAVHGVAWLWQPTPVVAATTWGVYGLALGLRGTGGWGGRRAAYLAVAGFVGLLLTLGVSLILPTRHVLM